MDGTRDNVACASSSFRSAFAIPLPGNGSARGTAPTAARSDQTTERFLATGVTSAAICETGEVTFETCVEIEGMPDATNLNMECGDSSPL